MGRTGGRFVARASDSGGSIPIGRTCSGAAPLRGVSFDPFPPLPPDGFHSEEEIAKLPGVRVIEAADTFPGPTPETYAYSRQSAQRNLYRVPLP